MDARECNRQCQNVQSHRNIRGLDDECRMPDVIKTPFGPLKLADALLFERDVAHPQLWRLLGSCERRILL